MAVRLPKKCHHIFSIIDEISTLSCIYLIKVGVFDHEQNKDYLDLKFILDRQDSLQPFSRIWFQTEKDMQKVANIFCRQVC